MDIFDPSYDVEMKELIFPEYKMNKFIYVQMVYVIGDNYEHNIL